MTYSCNVAIPTAHRLKYSLIQSQLEASLIKHLPFIGITSDKTVHLHSFALPNSMAPCLGLVFKKMEGKQKGNEMGGGVKDT